MVWGLIGLEPAVRGNEAGLALALQLAVAVALFWRRRWERRSLATLVGLTMFLVSVMLLRDGVGRVVSGYGTLVLLPVVWAALRDRRGELVMALVGVVVVEFAPLIIIGDPRYPASGWRTGALMIVVVAVVGGTILTLVGRVRASEREYRLLAENSSDLVVRISRKGAILYASPASHPVLGRTPEQLVGTALAQWTHPDDLAEREERIRRIDAGPLTGTRLTRMLHADGRWLWLEATVRSLRDQQGEVVERQLAFRDVTERVHRYEEHRALSRIATLVAAGEASAAVFDAAAAEVARVAEAAISSVVRFDAAAIGTIVGISTIREELVKRCIDLAGPSASGEVYRTRAVVRIERYSYDHDDPAIAETRITGAVGAPVTVSGELWGAVVAAYTGELIPDGVEHRLARFADLLSMAIANAHALETLAEQASLDPVTGLSNHRVFHSRLREEVQRALRHGHSLTLAIIDVDHFKHVNDTHGHPVGDRVLKCVGQRIAGHARAGDLVARIGGDEFAWLMPETDAGDGLEATDRARQAIAALTVDGVESLSVSAGVHSCGDDLNAELLIRGADEALYGAKAAGRNRALIRAAASSLQPLS